MVLDASLSPPSRLVFCKLQASAIVLLVLATPCFVALAMLVASEGHLNVLDAQAGEWAQRMRSPAWTSFFLAITHLHSVMAITAYTAGLSVLLAMMRNHRHWLLPLWMIVPGGALLNLLMKRAFERPRPVMDDALLTLSTFSFPSGHASSTTLMYGFGALVALTHLGKASSRAVVGMLALLLIALVGWSRVYLGVHYFTDVLAGVAEGLMWLALCVIALSARRRPG
ncbi:phosphatase PAP2 family protein [Aquabacterium sp. CECT 9606]|uniref:phosphatase PAP2 family protein n=1 Tax=Aquabacterium sp. CECT 9606 TaxID=2845822 RepID=UPI001E4E386B|nr:phosphatase PAP2 family protein [Aquabacterium sp. CECT 9606]CAH0351712.1 hypothetical protein AQB9606_02377 [Aquabacterium sp. CECT 9606]